MQPAEQQHRRVSEPYLRSASERDDALAALGRTPKGRRDRNPLASHSDASFLQIAAGPGNLRFTEGSIWRISVQMFKRAKFT